MEENKKVAIEKIYQLTKQDAEFNEELRKKLGITSVANSAVIDDERLNQIYEYCIEKILRKQAENFYELFDNETTKEQLVHDYIRMESFRRKNEFGDYALALYQQIETILNTIFGEPDFKDTINATFQEVFFKYSDKNKRIVEWTIASIVFGTDTEEKKWFTEGMDRLEKDKLNARDKMRIVLFYFKYYANSDYDIENKNYKSSYNYNDFKTITDALWKIYSCRNTNHRSAGQNENEIVNKILQESSYSYFHFNWILTEFVWLTKDYKKTIAEIKEKAPLKYKAIITQLLSTGKLAFVKIENESQPTRVPDNLLKKMKHLKIGDSIIVIKKGDEIIDIYEI